MRRWLLVLIFLVLLPTPAWARPSLTFSDPMVSPLRIQTPEIADISHAPRGSTINVANSLMSCDYAAALTSAMHRGVTVHWYTLRRNYSRYICGPQLARALTASSRSSVRICENSCYDGPWAASKGYSSSVHAKTLQIVYPSGRIRTEIGSNDWSAKVPGKEYNTLFVTHNHVIGRAVQRWFNGMRLHKPMSYYPKYVRTGNIALEQYPNPAASGSNNAYTHLLSRVACHGNTQVRVLTSQFQGVMRPVLNRLIQLKHNGCLVKIISNPLRVAPSIVKLARHAHLSWRWTGALSGLRGPHNHSKIVLVSSRWHGSTHRMMLEGSSNMGRGWYSENHMVSLGISPSQYGQALHQFDRVWNTGHGSGWK